MTLAKIGALLRRIAVWTAIGLGSLVALVVALIVVFNLVRPYRWHEMVIDTGNEQIIGAQFDFCGRDQDVEIRPGRARVQFPDLCEGGATALLETANAQYSCVEGYIPTGWRATTFMFKIDKGKCESVGESERGPVKWSWRSPPEP